MSVLGRVTGLHNVSTRQGDGSTQCQYKAGRWVYTMSVQGRATSLHNVSTRQGDGSTQCQY